MSLSSQEKIIRYYELLGSRLGYDYILGGAIHFGYYPNSKKLISEKEAQEEYHKLVGNTLHLVPNDLVLDAGCGEGVVACFLTKHFGSRIVGINIVPRHIIKANKRAKEFGCDNKVEFQLTDYSETKFPDNFFDAIYTTESLSHSPDVLKTLKEFFRILKSGGRIALFEYTIAMDDKFSPREKKMLDAVIRGSAMLGLKQFRHDKFPYVINAAGFKDIETLDITQNIKPSFNRLHRLGKIPYLIIRALSAQESFPNLTASYEYYKMAENGLFRYCIFIASK